MSLEFIHKDKQKQSAYAVFIGVYTVILNTYNGWLYQNNISN
jgi:hypothetical protein